MSDTPDDKNTQDTDTTTDVSSVENETKVGAAPPSSENVNYVASDTTELQIGDDIGLTNKDPTLKSVTVAAGWDIKSLEGEPPDLDLSCFILNKDGKTRKDPDFVFYNNMQSEEEEIVHKGDNRTGAGDGDDEEIDIDLQALSFDAATIAIVLSFHEGDIKDHDFSMVRNVFVRVLNGNTKEELCKLEIPDEFLNSQKGGAAMKMATLFRDGPKWRFHADSVIPKKGSLRSIAIEYDIIII